MLDQIKRIFVSNVGLNPYAQRTQANTLTNSRIGTCKPCQNKLRNSKVNKSEEIKMSTSSRQAWLVNNANPQMAPSNKFDVRAGAVRITAANCVSPVALYQRVGNSPTSSYSRVVRYGVPVVFGPDNSQYVEIVAGSYMVDGTAAGPNALVWLEEEDVTSHDAKVIYEHNPFNYATISG